MTFALPEVYVGDGYYARTDIAGMHHTNGMLRIASSQLF